MNRKNPAHLSRIIFLQFQTKNIEYGKQYVSTMEVKGTGRKHMEEIRRCADYGGRTVKVILQFPEESQDVLMIRESVKSILMLELEGQLKGILAGNGKGKEDNCLETMSLT